MKEHISITIDRDLVKLLKKTAIQERRSVSQLVEIAIDQFLEHNHATEGLETTSGSFNGTFSREDTYGAR